MRRSFNTSIIWIKNKVKEHNEIDRNEKVSSRANDLIL